MAGTMSDNEYSTHMQHQNLDDVSVLVAGVDFGTTYSGYGFSFKNTPNKIIANKNWGEELGMSSYKAPTSVLLDKYKEFVAFGYEAEHKYSQVCMTDEGKDYDLFRHFKMMLYHKRDLNRRSTIKSTKGREWLALEIVGMSLKYMKNHLIEAVSKQCESCPDQHMIKWVITVPAIWNDKAKQFMREAAVRAGLIPNRASKQLLLALEPEAASVLCRNLDVHNFRDVKSHTDVKFDVGTKYMIIDAGGGTVDIAVHEILEAGNMKEIACGSGGSWGGRNVDEKFVELITNILGKQFIEAFKKNCPSDWLEFLTGFELKKKATNLNSGSSLSMQLSWSIARSYTQLTGLQIDDVIRTNSHRGVSFRSGNIIFNEEVVMGWFNPVIEHIITHVQSQMKQNQYMSDLKYIMLVGGFSESNILFQKLQHAFASTVPVISPSAAGLAIVKGAVLFGHNPKVITERIARRTYGSEVDMPFDPDTHDVSRKFFHIEEKIDFCRSVFKVFISLGDNFKVDDKKLFYSKPQFSTTTCVIIPIFTSDRTDIMYSDEPGVVHMGSLSLDMPLSLEERTIETKIYFGATELEVQCTDVSTHDGQSVKCTVDFLQDKLNTSEAGPLVQPLRHLTMDN